MAQWRVTFSDPEATTPHVRVRRRVQFLLWRSQGHDAQMAGLPRPLADKLERGITEFAVVMDTEEKGSDVSLGAHLVWDACHRDMDVALVLSNDSDFQTPVTMAEEAGVRVVTVNPHKQSDQPRRLISSDKRTLNRRLLARCQLPNPVIDERGEQIRRPPEWSQRAKTRRSGPCWA